MNRRDFLKLSPLALFGCAFRPKEQTDLQALFDNAGEGDVIDIPSGYHEIHDSLRVKAWQTIRCTGVIVPVGDFTGRPVVDYSGAFNTSTHGLRVYQSSGASCAVKVSRAPTGHGAGNRFYDCFLQGAYGESVLWSNSEGNSYDGCQFVTENDRPAVRFDGANTLGWWSKCSFRNYSGLESVALVRLGNTVSGLSWRDCYFFTGTNGTAVLVAGTASTCIIHDCRQEGDGVRSLLLDNSDASTLYQWSVARINYTIPSEAMIRTGKLHLHECEFDLHRTSTAKRYFQTGGGMLWRCRVHGHKADWINYPSKVRMNHLFWTQFNPLPNGAGDNVVHWTG
jgi:hypothetical protein